MNEVDITDAIYVDVTSYCSLPSFTPQLYVPAPVLRGDIGSGRYLSVYPVGVQPDLVATPSSYEDWHMYHVAWSVPVFRNFEDNITDNDAIKAALEAQSEIRERLQTYGCGIPTLGVTAVLEDIRYEVPWDGNGMWHAVNRLRVEAFT